MSTNSNMKKNEYDVYLFEVSFWYTEDGKKEKIGADIIIWKEYSPP